LISIHFVQKPGSAFVQPLLQIACQTLGRWILKSSWVFQLILCINRHPAGNPAAALPNSSLQFAKILRTKVAAQQIHVHGTFCHQEKLAR